MTALWQWILTNKVAIIAGVVLVAKWIYNALPANGQPFVFSNFLRLILGEIVQEAPADSTKWKLAGKAAPRA
jgi:hypothetical protein